MQPDGGGGVSKRRKLALVDRLVLGALMYRHEAVLDPLRAPKALAKFRRLCQRVMREAAKGEK
jgi:hypothetical protein